MSEKDGKSTFEGTILTWEDLALRTDLIGGTVEIARNCTTEDEATHYQFTRGLVTDILWKKSKRPERVYFRDARRCDAKGEALGEWEHSDWEDFTCDLGNLRKKVQDPRVQNAWIGESGVIHFFTLDPACVALFPKGVTPTTTPFFYEMAVEEEASRQMLLRKHVGFRDE